MKKYAYLFLAVVFIFYVNTANAARDNDCFYTLDPSMADEIILNDKTVTADKAVFKDTFTIGVLFYIPEDSRYVNIGGICITDADEEYILGKSDGEDTFTLKFVDEIFFPEAEDRNIYIYSNDFWSAYFYRNSHPSNLDGDVDMSIKIRDKKDANRIVTIEFIEIEYRIKKFKTKILKTINSIRFVD